ncbi:MAG: hypothetical protein ABSF46_04080 [Terriglobia bacterium]|jgi:hypothetical protein
MDLLTNAARSIQVGVKPEHAGRIEVAQRMAGHSNAKTTGLYDRRNDDISAGEVERIGF